MTRLYLIIFIILISYLIYLFSSNTILDIKSQLIELIQNTKLETHKELIELKTHINNFKIDVQNGINDLFYSDQIKSLLFVIIVTILSIILCGVIFKSFSVHNYQPILEDMAQTLIGTKEKTMSIDTNFKNLFEGVTNLQDNVEQLAKSSAQIQTESSINSKSILELKNSLYSIKKNSTTYPDIKMNSIMSTQFKNLSDSETLLNVKK